MSSSSESSEGSSPSDSSSSESRSSSSTVAASPLPAPVALPLPVNSNGRDSSSSEEGAPLDYGKIATVEEDAAVSGVPFFRPADISSDSDSESGGAKAAEPVEQIPGALSPPARPTKSKKEMRRSGKRPKTKVRR